MQRILFFILIMTSIVFSQTRLKDYVKESKETDIKKWKLKNPSFRNPRKSFFSSTLTKRLIVFPLSVNNEDLSVLDCENRILRQLVKKDKMGFKLLKGKDADPVWGGDKLIPTKFPKILILVYYKVIQGEILSWSKGGVDECHLHYTFPFLKIASAEISNDPHKEYFHIVLGIYSPLMDLIKSRISSANIVPTSMDTLKGSSIAGTGVDLNNDSIQDIFLFDEKINPEGDTYLRIYINIDGKWECVWVEYREVCV